MSSGVSTSSSAANCSTMRSSSEASRRPSVYCMRSLMEPFFVSTSTISFSASGQRPAFTSYWF